MVNAAENPAAKIEDKRVLPSCLPPLSGAPFFAPSVLGRGDKFVCRHNESRQMIAAGEGQALPGIIVFNCQWLSTYCRANKRSCQCGLLFCSRNDRTSRTLYTNRQGRQPSAMPGTSTASRTPCRHRRHTTLLAPHPARGRVKIVGKEKTTKIDSGIFKVTINCYSLCSGDLDRTNMQGLS